MEGPLNEGEVTLSSGGVAVRKRIELVEFPSPSIVFTVCSERERGAAVRLVEPVPESVDVRDLAFHSEYGREHWRVSHDVIEFEYRLDPGEEYVTAYGIEADAVDLGSFMAEPTLEVDPAPGTDSRGSTAAADGRAAGERPARDPLSDSGGQQLRPSETSADADRTLVDELVTEIRAGRVPPERVDALRDALGVGGTDGTVEARVSRLQSDVADLRAYTDALEGFLEDHGRGTRLLEDVESRLDALEEEHSTLRTTALATEENLERIGERVDHVESDVDAIDEEMAALGETLDDLQARLADLEEHDPEETAARVSALEDDVESLQATWERLETVFGDAGTS